MDQIDCVICLSPAVANKKCIHCRNIFCGRCIGQWLSRGRSNTCPTCRHPTTIETGYSHDKMLEAAIANMMTSCDMCGTELQCCELLDHRVECGKEEITCPFQGCSFSAPRNEMDRHTVGCGLYAQYDAASVIDGICKRAMASVTASSSSFTCPLNEGDAALLRVVNEEQERMKACDGSDGTLVHMVQLTDTLHGIAIKYDTTKSSIMQMNSLSSENQLFGRRTIVVPKPANYNVEKERFKESKVPMEVIVALKKRTMTNKLVYSCSLSREEALSYLHLTLFNLTHALDLVKEDDAWLTESGKGKQGYSSLKEFLARKNSSASTCHRCSSSIYEHSSREHCRSCGSIFCGDCCFNEKECTRVVAKHILGVTNPENMKDEVPVCMQCYEKLLRSGTVSLSNLAVSSRPMNQLPPSHSDSSPSSSSSSSSSMLQKLFMSMSMKKSPQN